VLFVCTRCIKRAAGIDDDRATVRVDVGGGDDDGGRGGRQGALHNDVAFDDETVECVGVDEAGRVGEDKGVTGDDRGVVKEADGDGEGRAAKALRGRADEVARVGCVEKVPAGKTDLLRYVAWDSFKTDGNVKGDDDG